MFIVLTTLHYIFVFLLQANIHRGWQWLKAKKQANRQLWLHNLHVLCWKIPCSRVTHLAAYPGQLFLMLFHNPEVVYSTKFWLNWWYVYAHVLSAGKRSQTVTIVGSKGTGKSAHLVQQSSSSELDTTLIESDTPDVVSQSTGIL